MKTDHRKLRDAALADASAEVDAAEREGRPVNDASFNRAMELADYHNFAAKAEKLRPAFITAPAVRTVVPTSGTGLALDPTSFASVPLDTLRAQSVGLASGIQQLYVADGAQSLTIAAFTADAAGAAVAAGASISATDSTATTVVARPRKYATRSTLAQEQIEDMTPAARQAYIDTLVRGIANTVDLAFYEGSGSGENITGMKNISGINSVSMGTNGAALTNLDPFVDAFAAIQSANATPAAIVMHPKTWQQLSKVRTLSSGSNQPLLSPNAQGASASLALSILGVPVFLSSQLSTTEAQGSASTCSSVYVYDTAQVYSVWRALPNSVDTVRVESIRSAANDTTDLLATTRVDLAVPNPTAITRIKGVLIA